MAFDWGKFAEKVGGGIERGAGILAGDIMEKGETKRQLETLRKQLEIGEEFKVAAFERLLEGQKKLASHNQQLEKDKTIWQTEYNAGLQQFLGDPGLQKILKKAMTSADPLVQAQATAMQKELDKGMRGEEMDMEIFEGLPQYSRVAINGLYRQNVDRAREFKQREDELKIVGLKLEETLEYHKGLQEARESVRERREFTTFKDVQNAIKGTRKDLHDEKREFMQALSDADIITAKGKYRRGVAGLGALWKNKPILDPETGDFDIEVISELLEKYPQFRFRFERIIELDRQLMQYLLLTDAYKKGQEEIVIPEEEIKAAMDKGLTREQAISLYEKYLKDEKK